MSMSIVGVVEAGVVVCELISAVALFDTRCSNFSSSPLSSCSCGFLVVTAVPHFFMTVDLSDNSVDAVSVVVIVLRPPPKAVLALRLRLNDAMFITSSSSRSGCVSSSNGISSVGTVWGRADTSDQKDDGVYRRGSLSPKRIRGVADSLGDETELVLVVVATAAIDTLALLSVALWVATSSRTGSEEKGDDAKILMVVFGVKADGSVGGGGGGGGGCGGGSSGGGRRCSKAGGTVSIVGSGGSGGGCVTDGFVGT